MQRLDPLSLGLGRRFVSLFLGELTLNAGHIVCEQPQAGITDIGLDGGRAPCHFGLPAQRFQLTTQFTGEVREPLKVELDLVELAQGLLLAPAVLQNARGLLDEPPPVLGAGVQDGVEAPLTDDDVHLPADAGVREQFLDVEKPARLAVDGVLGTAAAEQGSPDRHLGVVDRERPVGVVDSQLHLGSAQRRFP